MELGGRGGGKKEVGWRKGKGGLEKEMDHLSQGGGWNEMGSE